MGMRTMLSPCRSTPNDRDAAGFALPAAGTLKVVSCRRQILATRKGLRDISGTKTQFRGFI
jgi:hypothetical protein